LLTFIKSRLEEINMPESMTAEIIPFPSRAVAPIEPASPTLNPPPVAKPTGRLPGKASHRAEPAQAEARLTRALAGLNNAVTAQRAAMTAWQAALGDLKTVTARLGASLRSYNDSLGHLDARVNTLRTEAVKLEAWADDALAKKL
jgi:hypothetical protein